MNPTLRRGDGYRDRTPHLRDDVLKLQTALNRAGFETDTDGLFGAGTQRTVKAFQRDRGLSPDGVVGRDTWAALTPAAVRNQQNRHADVPGFETFHGELAWLHGWEGHAGTAYWPGGRSGVTLDPGYDMGHHTLAETKKLYTTLLTPAQYTELGKVAGLTGPAARDALAARPKLTTISISKARALKVMPHVAVPYWTAVSRRFGILAESTTPGSVQTALLSLAYNRGPRSNGMDVLTAPLQAGEWLEVANRIGAMQQDHSLRGVRRRRRAEADLIRDELDVA